MDFSDWADSVQEYECKLANGCWPTHNPWDELDWQPGPRHREGGVNRENAIFTPGLAPIPGLLSPEGMKQQRENGTHGLLSGPEALEWTVMQDMVRRHPYSRLSHSERIALMDARLAELSREYGFEATSSLYDFFSCVGVEIRVPKTGEGSTDPLADLFQPYRLLIDHLRPVADFGCKMRFGLEELAHTTERYIQKRMKHAKSLNAKPEVIERLEVLRRFVRAEAVAPLVFDSYPERQWVIDFSIAPFPDVVECRRSLATKF